MSEQGSTYSASASSDGTTKESPVLLSQEEMDYDQHVNPCASEGCDVPDGEDENSPNQAAIAPDGLLEPSVWIEGLGGMLKVGGHMTGLKTLQDAPAQETFHPAAQEIYNTLLETPALHWALRPDHKWVNRVVVIGAFSVPLVTGVAGELKERKKARLEAQEAHKRKMRPPAPGKAAKAMPRNPMGDETLMSKDD